MEAPWPFLMSVFSFPAGINPDVLLRPGFQGEAASAPTPTKPPAPKLKRRARDAEGQFKPDDPATPQDEAWEGSPSTELAASSL